MAVKKKKGGRIREVAASPYETEPSIKKNIRLHQSKIDAARKILGTETETETIEQALDLVVFRQELLDGMRAMRGAKIVNYFDEHYT